jgi:hypothetical protein
VPPRVRGGGGGVTQPVDAYLRHSVIVRYQVLCPRGVANDDKRTRVYTGR